MKVCHLQLLLVLTSTVILRSNSLGTHDHILLSQIQNSPNLEGQVPYFLCPRNRVAQSHPQALGSLFVASYDLQGYSGGVVSGKDTLRLGVYCQSGRLGIKPFETHDLFFFN
jgi:hypothetical protein